MEIAFCECCDELMPEQATQNPYGEFICESCEQNATEAAWERYCEDFHDGGCTRFVTLEQQMADARRFK